MGFRKAAWVWMLSVILKMALAFSQGAPEASQNKIALGTGVAVPGQQVSLPLYLSTSDQEKIGGLTLEISFPSPPLTFSEVERAFLAEQVDAKLSAEVTGTKVLVKASVPQGKDSPLPEGLLAFVKFRVSEDAKAGDLKVVAEKVEMKDLKGQSVETSGKVEGQINVISKEMAPLAACFFYMH